MTLPLRERRRQQTAREIQRATLTLAIEHGLENIRTDAIAKAAGISSRTFFNYYANKEAAAIGTPPGFAEADLAALRNSSAPLAEGIKRLLDGQITRLAENLDVVGMVRQVIQSSLSARNVLERSMDDHCAILTECLVARMLDHDVASVLADSVIRCSARTIFLWERDKARTLPEALDLAWETQMCAARILSSPSEERAEEPSL